jgi:type VI secretion system ImpA family protein
MSLESLDWDALVSPISKKSPAGEDIKNDPVFDEIKTSRKPRELEELDSSDWLKVEKLCVEALSKQCKHLQVATWLLEAVGHLYGYAGAAKGFEFLAEMIDKFWEDFFPKIDTDDEDDPLGYRIPIMGKQVIRMTNSSEEPWTPFLQISWKQGSQKFAPVRKHCPPWRKSLTNVSSRRRSQSWVLLVSKTHWMTPKGW